MKSSFISRDLSSATLIADRLSGEDSLKIFRTAQGKLVAIVNSHSSPIKGIPSDLSPLHLKAAIKLLNSSEVALRWDGATLTVQPRLLGGAPSPFQKKVERISSSEAPAGLSDTLPGERRLEVDLQAAKSSSYERGEGENFKEISARIRRLKDERKRVEETLEKLEVNPPIAHLYHREKEILSLQLEKICVDLETLYIRKDEIKSGSHEILAEAKRVLQSRFQEPVCLSNSEEDLGALLIVPKGLRPKGPLLPSIAFGKEKWEKYFGRVEAEPPLSNCIEDILDTTCPFSEKLSVRKSHVLTLIPKTLNGRPLDLSYLEELVKCKLKQESLCSGFFLKILGGNARKPASPLELYKARPPFWALMTRGWMRRKSTGMGSSSMTEARMRYEQAPKMVLGLSVLVNSLFSEDPSFNFENWRNIMWRKVG